MCTERKIPGIWVSIWLCISNLEIVHLFSAIEILAGVIVAIYFAFSQTYDSLVRLAGRPVAICSVVITVF